MKYCFVALVFLSLPGGCFSKGNKAIAGEVGKREIAEPNPPYHIALEHAVNNPTPAGISEIGRSITYIPLETTAASGLGVSIEIAVTDSHIFVVNNQYDLMKFDRNGKFMWKTGPSYGRNPGEYRYLLDFCLSPDGRYVYFNGGGGKVFKYGVDGNFVDVHLIEPSFTHLECWSDDLFVFGNGNEPADRDPADVAVFMSGLDNETKKTYKTFLKRDTGVSLAYCSLYSFDGNIRYSEPFSNTLVTVTPDSLITHATFDLGSAGVPFENYSDNFSVIGGWYSLYKITESTRGIFLSLTRFVSDDDLYGFFDKQTGETRVVGENGFTNDFDGGLPFFPEYVAADGTLVDYVDAYALKEHVASLDAEEMTRLYGKRFTKLADLAADLKDDDNPVLIMVK